MNLYEIGRYKAKLKSKICQCNLIKDCLLGKGYDEDYVDELLDKQVFSYLYVPDTQTEVKTYICFDTRITRVPNDYIKDMQLVVRIFSHKDDIKYSKAGYSGIKPDILAQMFDKDVLGEAKHDFGIGHLKLESVDIYQPDKDYYGRQLVYSCSEFYKES